MKSVKKNVLSILVCSVFIFMALASSKKILPRGVFDESKPRGEVIPDTLGCLVLKNETRVYGNKVRYQSGAVVKNQVQIDGKKFPMKEVRGYYLNGMYYGLYKTDFYKRVLHGKINIYYGQATSTNNMSNYNQRWNKTTTRTVEYVYWQKGESGDFNPLHSWKHVKQAVKDCPLAYELANRKKGVLKKEVKKDEEYLWRIFEIYNNNCDSLIKK